MIGWIGLNEIESVEEKKMSIGVRATKLAVDQFFNGKQRTGVIVGTSRTQGMIRVRLTGNKSSSTYAREFWQPLTERPNKFGLPQYLIDLIDLQDFSKPANVEWAIKEAYEMGRKAGL